MTANRLETGIKLQKEIILLENILSAASLQPHLEFLFNTYSEVTKSYEIYNEHLVYKIICKIEEELQTQKLLFAKL